ncbi:linear gramicidin synthetase subunit D domain protein [Mycobacterium xenopi 4042]|uniref:Linear gramicidin synthetase subunit D domain protein n=1 Tax=Mycobacterium xenopi 4042 TaxID=1299334 RepID=X8BKU9_MYCXE|nr:linear gramicidin synthetase subunit D domain protein [Mycobacterium xenopi 4042]
MTNHHIVLDGWSLPILLGRFSPAIRASDCRGWIVSPVRCLVAERDLEAAAPHGARCWPVSTPRLWWPPQPVGQGSRGVRSARLPAQTTRAVSELARRITPPSTPCCRAPSRSC